MDYAFVPGAGATDYETTLQNLLKARKNTKVIDDQKVKTVRDFLQKLVAMNVVADNLLLGAHASDQTFAISFDDKTSLIPQDSDGHDYEELLVLDTNGRIRIPVDIRNDDTDVHLKGCDIGRDVSKPFLALLKDALDKPRHVTAPKFVHALKQDGDRGVLEYMKYQYEIVSPTAFSTHDELIEAFKKGNLLEGKFKQGVEVPGTPVDVPDANWKVWVQKSLDLKPAVIDEVPFDIATKVDPAIGKLKLIDQKNGLCRSRYQDYTASTYVTGTMPPDDAGKMAFLKDALKTDRRLKDGHPFPLWVRFGYPDLDAFIKGMTWIVLTDKTLLHFIGSHYVYTLQIPVVKTNTNKLVYNYYPKSGTPNFAEDNANFAMFGVE